MPRPLVVAIAGLMILAASRAGARVPTQAADTSADLEAMRESGDLTSQRLYIWQVLTQLLKSPDGKSDVAFESWIGEGDAFSTAPADPTRDGIRAFSRATSTMGKGGPKGGAEAPFPNAPVLAFTLYNAVAYDHIRAHRLNRLSELARLRSAGPVDREFADDRSIPPFPRDAMVLKTVWWPVAEHEVTSMPVWDSSDDLPRRSGNNYLQWQRAVIIDPTRPGTEPAGSRSAEFVGRSFPESPVFGLAAFHHISVDARLARQLNRDNEAHRAGLLALGRPFRAGDYLVLVGMNLAAKDIENWVWASLWWHDHPDQGPFAAGRPEALPSAWRHYLMRVAFDAEKPAEARGGAHVCFNPWLEARFPDGGHGGGELSNCLACHRRASYPPVNFLPVTRGAPDPASDPAYAPGRLRTGFLWSIALHATP
jgi:hypothetical protein